MKSMTDDCAQEGAAGPRKAFAEARLSPPGGGRPRLPAGSGGAVGLTEAGPPRLCAGQAGVREGFAAPGESVSAVSAAPGARQADRRIAGRRRAEVT